MFTGKVALVTGGGSGIGRATAIAFADKGAKVAIVDKDDRGGRGTVKKIRGKSGDAAFFAADVSQAKDVASAVNGTITKYGRLDYAFNNAGIAESFDSIVDVDESDWDRVLAVNLKGVWLCMKYEIPEMLKENGAIVNMSSAAGLRGVPAGGAYVASKHGVVGLTRTAALELAENGIRVNAVCPTVIQTPLATRFQEEYPGVMESYIEQNPMKRPGSAEEVAQVVTWLCSDQASFINGLAIPVDGGSMAK